MCFGLILGIGLAPNAQAHCTWTHPGHCISQEVQKAARTVVGFAETVDKKILQPVSSAFVSAGKSIAKFTQTQIDSAVKGIKNAYNEAKTVYNQIKKSTEIIINAQKMAADFAINIEPSLGLISIKLAKGLVDGKNSNLKNGLEHLDGGQILDGIASLFSQMTSIMLDQLVTELNRQEAGSLLIGFQYPADVGFVGVGMDVASIGGVAIDVNFLNWLNNEIENKGLKLNTLSADTLRRYSVEKYIVASVFWGYSSGFSGSAGLGGVIASPEYFIGYHVNPPYATEGHTVDFTSSASGTGVSVSFNRDKFLKELVFEAGVVSYSFSGTSIDLATGSGMGYSKMLSILCSDGKLYNNYRECSPVARKDDSIWTQGGPGTCFVDRKKILDNGLVSLWWQGDGNLVLYTGNRANPDQSNEATAVIGGKALWASHTSSKGKTLCFLPEGDLQITNQDRYPIWRSHTAGKGRELKLQTDCNLVIYDSNKKPHWAIDMSCPLDAPLNYDTPISPPTTSGNISLGSHHGTNLGVRPDGSVYANSNLLSWEKFTQINNGDGTVSFRSHHSTYLGVNLEGLVYAVPNLLSSEKFRIIGSL